MPASPLQALAHYVGCSPVQVRSVREPGRAHGVTALPRAGHHSHKGAQPRRSRGCRRALLVELRVRSCAAAGRDAQRAADPLKRPRPRRRGGACHCGTPSDTCGARTCVLQAALYLSVCLVHLWTEWWWVPWSLSRQKAPRAAHADFEAILTRGLTYAGWRWLSLCAEHPYQSAGCTSGRRRMLWPARTRRRRPGP